MSQECELCGRSLAEGYSGSVCAVCKQDFSDKYSTPVKMAPEPSQTEAAQVAAPYVSTVVNPTAPVQQVHIHQAPAPVVRYAAPSQAGVKSKTTFVLLGVFLGQLGIHNFYAGYTGKAVAQLAISLLLCWTIAVPVIIWIWAIVEVCTVTTDSDGNWMT